jgi:hypothetical protein
VEPPPFGVLKNQRFDVDCSPKAGKRAKQSSGELRFFTIVAILSAIHRREHHPPRRHHNTKSTSIATPFRENLARGPGIFPESSLSLGLVVVECGRGVRGR